MAEGSGRAEEATGRPKWPAIGIALLWTALTPFLMGVVAGVVTLAERATGHGTVNGNVLAAGAIEAIVYLVVSFGVFRMARHVGVPQWFWLAGPAGYLLGAAAYLVLGTSAGGVLALSLREGTVMAVDTAACACGAYVGARAHALARAGS